MSWHRPPKNYAEKLTKAVGVSEMVLQKATYSKLPKKAVGAGIGQFEPRAEMDQDLDPIGLTKLLDAVSVSCPTSGMFHFYEHQSLHTTKPPVHPLEEQVKKLVVPAMPSTCSELDGMAPTSDIVTAICIEHAESQDLSLPLIQHIEHITKEQRSCDLWIALHRGRITSSNFHDVLVRKATTPPDNLVKRLMSYEAFHGTAATEHGKRHEDYTRRTYRSYRNYPGHTGLTVQPSGLTLHDTMSFLGASADGLVHDPQMKPADGILEIKCPFSIAGEDVRSMPPAEIARKHPASFCLQVKPDGGLQLKRNHKFYTQVQRELAVKGRQWADFVIWTLAPSDNIFVKRTMADKSFWHDMLLPKLVQFYTSAMVPEILLRRIQCGLPLFASAEVEDDL